MTLKEKIHDLLFLKIRNLEEELKDLKDMKERLKSIDNKDINSILGVVNWYYKEKTKQDAS